jgi:hypothetical protein
MAARYTRARGPLGMPCVSTSMAVFTAVCTAFSASSWAEASADADAEAVTVVHTQHGDVWVTPLRAPADWKEPAVGDSTRGGAVPEGVCPRVSGLDPDVTPISLVIGIHRVHISLAPRTVFHACIDQSTQPTEVIVVCGGVNRSEMDTLAQIYWPCRGVFVGTDKPLKADAVRNIGGFLAKHTVTTFLDGDDIAGPQWMDAVRYFYNATRFAVLTHAWNNCGTCDGVEHTSRHHWNKRVVPARMWHGQGDMLSPKHRGADWKLNRRCPDRCDPDGPLDNCKEGFQWCLNSSIDSPALAIPQPVKCFTADELQMAKMSILDPRLTGKFPFLAMSHMAVSHMKTRSTWFTPNVGSKGNEDWRFLKDIARATWAESFLNPYLRKVPQLVDQTNAVTQMYSDRTLGPLLKAELKTGTWGGGPWGSESQPHANLLAEQYCGKFALYVRLVLTCKCIGESTHSVRHNVAPHFFVSGA